ncbi:hypothetical protein CHISP_2199 [Chitinispirillum alkaliphilum]|nr:hypothetical protein CHISP_2199 [Chitinispirillum alkaliphilum]
MAGKFAACLFSRQHVHFSGTESWVKAAENALDFLKCNNFGLLTSTGMHSWNILTTMGRDRGMKMKVVVAENTHSTAAADSLFEQFDLEEQTELCKIPQNRSHRLEMSIRDKAVIENADLILPICIRPKGNFDSILKTLPSQKIDTRFSTPYVSAPNSHPRYTFTTKPWSDIEERYLYHWTRTSDTAWPTERLLDYYRDIISSREYPRSAFHTLINILKCRTIISSARHMPSLSRCVCFTSSPPQKFTALMKWRKRYRQMSFEPYGIGVEKTTAYHSGVIPVTYFDSAIKPGGKEELWRYQSRGTKGNWQIEQEYRCRGDFSLRGIPLNKLICFCYTRDEAKEIERLFGIRSLYFTT